MAGSSWYSRLPLRITPMVRSPTTAPPCVTVSSSSARAPVATQKASKVLLRCERSPAKTSVYFSSGIRRGIC
ncbi:hypothetical protein [Streptomyces decoyicus]|uniref:hypothetical protein n=1 Tax=Streptomyces decoyicus TaxID=249567 RepID=UPI0038685443